MRYILHAMRMNLRCAAQYRVSFLLQILAQFVMTAGDLMAVLLLMDRFGHMGHWSGYEVMCFFGAMQITFALTECFGRGLSTFSSVIRMGTFDTLLLRPRSLLKQVVLNAADPRRLGSLIVGIAALLVASATLSIPWTIEKVLLLIASIFGTLCVLCALFMLEASYSFFSVQGVELINTLTYGGRQTCQYPIDIYPGPIRLLFMWVAPIALCLHLPLSYILDKPIMALPQPVYWLTPVIGPLFFALITLIWRFGVRHYRGTGS